MSRMDDLDRILLMLVKEAYLVASWREIENVSLGKASPWYTCSENDTKLRNYGIFTVAEIDWKYLDSLDQSSWQYKRILTPDKTAAHAVVQCFLRSFYIIIVPIQNLNTTCTPNSSNFVFSPSKSIKVLSMAPKAYKLLINQPCSNILKFMAERTLYGKTAHERTKDLFQTKLGPPTFIFDLRD